MKLNDDSSNSGHYNCPHNNNDYTEFVHSPCTPPSPSSPVSPPPSSSSDEELTSPIINNNNNNQSQYQNRPYYVHPIISNNVIDLEDILTQGELIREPEDDNFNYVISMTSNQFIEKFHVHPQTRNNEFLSRTGKPIDRVIIKLQAVSTIIEFYNNSVASELLQKTFASPQIYVGDSILNYHINEIEAYERIEEHNHIQMELGQEDQLIHIPQLLQHGIIIDSEKTVKAFFLVISELNCINIKPSPKFEHLQKQAMNQIRLISSLGVTHNNISKRNVCIDEENERVHILDFGNCMVTEQIIDCSNFIDGQDEIRNMGRLFTN